MLYFGGNRLKMPTAQDVVDDGLENATVNFLVVEAMHFKREHPSLLHIDSSVTPSEEKGLKASRR